jgi:hypothetical protein
MPEDEDDIRDLAAELDDEPTDGIDAVPDDQSDDEARPRGCPARMNRGMEVTE